MYDKSKENKKHICQYIEEFPTCMPFLLHCGSDSSHSFSPFPPLFNMRIKKLRIPVTTYCSISLNSHCCLFQQVATMTHASRKVLFSLFFMNSLLIHPVCTNLRHPIRNPKMNSWLLRKQVGGYQKQKPEESSLRKETYIMLLRHIF